MIIINQNEVIKLLEENRKNKWDEEVIVLSGLSRTQFIKYVQEMLNGKWDYENRKWKFKRNLLIDANIETVYYFMDSKVRIPFSNIDWNIDKGLIDRNEVAEEYKYLTSKAYEGFKPKRNELVLRYVFDILKHPFDIFLVDQEMLRDSTGINREALHSYLNNMKVIFLGLALKNKVKLPLEITLNCLSSFPPSLYVSKIDTSFIDRMSMESKYLFQFLEINIDEFVIDYEKESINFRKGFKNPNDILYLIIFLLLEIGSNSFRDLNMKNISLIIWKRLLDKIGEILNVKSRKFFINALSVSYLYERITGMRVNLKSQFSFDIDDEIMNLLVNYKYYLLQNSGYLELHRTLSVIFEYREKHIKTIGELNLVNLKIIMDNYLNEAARKERNRKTIIQSIHFFCRGLCDIKEIFERTNSTGLTYSLPFNYLEIRFTDSYREDNLLQYALNKLEVMDFSKENGTYKDDILKVDSIARAIKNYQIKSIYEIDKVAYFNELQNIVALRILVETGIRISEVINIPYHFIGRVEEEDIDILVLSLNKLGEEFGVVPISKETALMIRECIEIRKRDFQDSIIDMPLYDPNRVKPKLKYPLQFIYISPKMQKYSRLSQNILGDFLDSICNEIEIERTKGKRFHMFRHRAAEYFFFCMSYYDEFDFKDDEDYKNEVIKKLLRHNDIEMTMSYSWGNLINLIAEKKLIFLKSLPSLELWQNTDSKIHYESIVKRINDEMENVITKNSINSLIKLLTAPAGMIQESTLELLSRNQSFKIINQYLKKIDGEKGVVPNGLAYFGMCTQFSCPKLKQDAKITCTSCNELILEKDRLPHLIAVIAKCQETIYAMGNNYIDDHYKYNHVHSLRARSISAQTKLFNDYGMTPEEIMMLIAEYFEGKLDLGENYAGIIK